LIVFSNAVTEANSEVADVSTEANSLLN
jgi:hypothetical protein